MCPEEMVLSTLQWLILALYIAAARYYYLDFMDKRDQNWRIAGRLLLAGIIAHTLQFVLFTWTFARIPIASVGEALSTFVLLTAAVYFVLEKGIAGGQTLDRSIGTFILPLCCLLLLISNVTPGQNDEIAEILKDVTFEFHVFSFLIAYAALMMAFIASGLYLLLERELRKRKLGLFYSRLPSLALFEHTGNGAVDIGFVFSTTGFALGFYLANSVWQTLFFTDVKFIAAGLVWVVYFIHFISRRVGHPGGRLLALLALTGFILILISFTLVSTLFTSLHRFI